MQHQYVTFNAFLVQTLLSMTMSIQSSLPCTELRPPTKMRFTVNHFWTYRIDVLMISKCLVCRVVVNRTLISRQLYCIFIKSNMTGNLLILWHTKYNGNLRYLPGVALGEYTYGKATIGGNTTHMNVWINHTVGLSIIITFVCVCLFGVQDEIYSYVEVIQSSDNDSSIASDQCSFHVNDYTL